jgi:hypothetical protein
MTTPGGAVVWQKTSAAQLGSTYDALKSAALAIEKGVVDQKIAGGGLLWKIA